METIKAGQAHLRAILEDISWNYLAGQAVDDDLKEAIKKYSEVITSDAFVRGYQAALKEVKNVADNRDDLALYQEGKDSITWAVGIAKAQIQGYGFPKLP